MQPVETFLDGLERSGFWDDVCKSCEKTFADTDPWSNPDTLCGECREDAFGFSIAAEEDVHFCPQCDGIAFELGSLGSVKHLRCRDCHWDFQE